MTRQRQWSQRRARSAGAPSGAHSQTVMESARMKRVLDACLARDRSLSALPVSELVLERTLTALREHERLAARAEGAALDGAVTAPKPGTVPVVQASLGDEVVAGTPLLVVEAMKMEHVLTAPIAGTVTELPVTAGRTVALDERLALVTPAATAPEQTEN